MNIVAERFIELSVLQRKRELTPAETREMSESLNYLEQVEWQKAKLKNFSLIASMTGNESWQHELCSQIDQLNH